MPESPAETPPGRTSAHAAHLAAWLWIAVVHAIVLALRLPSGLPRLTWLYSQGFVFAHTLVFGTVIAAGLWLWSKLPSWRLRLAPVMGVAVAFAVCWVALRDDFSGVVTRLPAGVSPVIWHSLLAFVVAMALALGHAVGGLLQRWWWRVAVLVAATTATVAHARLFPLAYPGVHLVVALGAGLGLAGALTGVPLRRPLPRWAARACAGAALAISVAGFVARPSNRTLIELSHQPVAVLMPFIAPHFSERATPFRVAPDQREWFVDRSRLGAVAPSGENPLPRDAIVLMIGVDSLRADLVADESRRALMPNFFALRDAGVWFTNVRSAGTSTAPAIASLFASRYYSQLHWTEYTKRRPEVFPHTDASPRFPEVLAAQQIPTVTVDTAGWLLNEFGIVRGFTEEQTARLRGYPSAQEAGRRVRERIAKHEGGAMFAFIHFLDAHAPYIGAGKKAAPFDGYLASLAQVDAEIGEWVKTVRERGLDGRVVWVLLSDHGEAFGEHGLTFHANSLYDELLRVPLVITARGLAPRRVDVPVSLVDVGPTIIDAYGLRTPSSMMGQSLLPFLAGKSRVLSRPILAEAQLKRALVTPEAVKVIHDTRRKTLEIYDLIRDPAELDNLIESAPGRHAELPGTLAHFFEVHTFRAPGYEVPFRRW
jgi:hypothetical protein